MKVFDRYFLKMALFNLALATLGVAALYVLIDYLYNIERLGEFSFSEVAAYYLVNVPPIIYLLGPLIALLGTSFALSRVLKNRELLPLSTGGLRSAHSLRMFWVAGVIAALAIISLRIVGLPELEDAAQKRGIVNLRKAEGEALGLRDAEGNHWRIGEFDLISGEAKQVEIVRYNERGEAETFVNAPHLIFDGNRWVGQRQHFRASGFATSNRATLMDEAEGPIEFSSLTPTTVATRGVRRTYRSPRRLAAMLSEAPHRLDLRVALYKIFAWPLLAIGLVLGGGVISLRLDLRNAYLAVATTLVLAFGGFAFVMVLEKLALKGSVGAELGIFAPPLVLMVLAIAGLRWASD